MIKTIGLSSDLSEKIVDIVLEKSQDDPLLSAQIQILLPTKRACIFVKNAFLRRSQKKSILVPQLIPIYELENLEEEIPPALSRLERTILLAKLCSQKPNMASPDQALKVALSLGELLDQFYLYETDTSKIKDLVQDPIFAEHWNETLVFLNILTEAWPLILKERGVIDEMDRRIRLVRHYTQKIKGTSHTIIAAGLDRNLPSTLDLLSTINTLPNGFILIDGLDQSFSEEEFSTLPASHFQNIFKPLLKKLNQSLLSVQALTPVTPRERLLNEVLLPEKNTEAWRRIKLPSESTQNITRIDCDTLSDEALTIAILLRGVLEEPQKTAVLVTPDRDLARRVITEMKRWNIELDDSVGKPATETEVGIFLRLINELLLEPQKASHWLSLLKHPLVADSENPSSFRKKVQTTEKIARQNRDSFKFSLKTDIQPIILLFKEKSVPFKELLKSHILLAETLAKSADRTAEERLWQSEDGQKIFEFLKDLFQKADLIGSIDPKYYPILFETYLASVTVRPLYGMHPRLDILDVKDARFHHYDVCIMSSLNEGTFPPIPDTGPWLNRSMLKSLSLPTPEETLIDYAFGFAHSFCSPKVYLTRSKKINGAETIPSRFLARLDAVLMGSDLSIDSFKNEFAVALDQPSYQDKIVRPSPCPPISARPRSLSVTKVELWMRNPYAIYARYILNLFPLEPLDNPQKQQIYGSAIHKTLEEFIQKDPNNVSQKELMEFANRFFDEFGLSSDDKAFYLPRFEQAALFIVEQQKLNQIQKSFVEQTGHFTFNVNEKPFTLKGTIDRIDLLKDGTMRILDYKTGSTPSLKEVLAGFAPQLPLEALLVQKDAFKEITNPKITELSYWKLAAKKEDSKVIAITKEQDANDLIQKSFEGLQNLILAFDHEQTPYEPCPIAGKEPTYNDYEYLSRSAEWAHGGDE